MRKLATVILVLFVVTLVLTVGCSPKPTPTPTPRPIVYSDTFTVQPGDTRYIPLTVRELNRIAGNFSVEGGSGNDIDFSIKDPFGNLLQQAGRVSRSQSFAFVAAAAGEYRLYFDNSFSTFSNKVVKYSVTVNWR